LDSIRIRGARTHNLRNIALDLPRNRLIVITGISGSGKSSLAFDTLYAEGQRRYVESLSAYARQFLEMMEKPDVDLIEGLSPAVAIEQKATSHNPRSTVGTVTEIHDYLRLLYARAGTPFCPDHGLPLEAQSVSQMVDHVLRLPEGHAPDGACAGHRGTPRRAGGAARRAAGARLHSRAHRRQGARPRCGAAPAQEYEAHHRGGHRPPAVRPDAKQRLAESFETALRHADGRAIAVETESGKEHLFSARFACPQCSYSLAELEPRLFSFNNPMGACPKCDGLGAVEFFDPQRVVAHPDLSLASGAIRGWDRRNHFYYSLLGVARRALRVRQSTSRGRRSTKACVRACCTARATRSFRSATRPSAGAARARSTRSKA
jgi:excinuclease ABC subunit A